MNRQFFLLLGALALTVLCGCTGMPSSSEMTGSFHVYNMYDSHMVLQRGRTIRFAGLAEPGKFVKVEFAGKTVYARAGVPSGVWEAEFPAMQPGAPQKLTVSAANGVAPVVYDDILIGEVWMCSGQSNMEMPLWSPSPNWRAANADAELKNSANDNIRIYNVSSRKSTSPFVMRQEPPGPGWQVCGPDTVGNFSALGYFFARELQKELNVPVGVVCTAWSGSRIEPWISEAMLREKHCKGLLQEREAVRATLESSEEAFLKVRRQSLADLKVWRQNFYNSDPDASNRAKAFKNTDFDDSKWRKAAIPGGFLDGGPGVGWYRCTFELPAEFAGKDLVLSLGAIDDCDETFFNGTFVGGIDDQNSDKYWSVSRVYNIPAKLVKAGKNAVAVRVADFGGDSGLTAGSTKELKLALKADPARVFTLENGWKFATEFKADFNKLGVRPNLATKRSYESPQIPSTLFNGLMSPWFRYPTRGAIWYQGCSNAGQEAYYKYFSMMIEDWRRNYGDKSMPFLAVQLAGYEKHNTKNPLPDDYWTTREPQTLPPYALTREIQAAVLNDVSDCGMAVAMDIGDHSDIHPRDKQSLGKRLAAEAMRIAYGKKGLSRGPAFAAMKVENGKVRVAFQNVGKGLTTKDGKAPGAFALAGVDGKLFWADAVIDGDTVVVSSEFVPQPKTVRYAFCSYRGDVNLMNQDGFPAEPFRSDAPDHKKLNEEK